MLAIIALVLIAIVALASSGAHSAAGCTDVIW